MLPLLLGTRKRLNKQGKGSLYNIVKQWYYDPNVWKVVFKFGIYGLCLPYSLKERYVSRFAHITSTPKGLIACETHTNQLHLLDEKYYIRESVSLPGTLAIASIKWLEDDRVSCTTTSGDVYIFNTCVDNYLSFQQNTTSIRHLTPTRTGMVWICGASLYSSDSKYGCKPSRFECTVEGVHKNALHAIAVDTRDFIYLLSPTGVDVYKDSQHVRSIYLDIKCYTGMVLLSYILIHNDILHIHFCNGILAAFTLEGKLLSSRYVGGVTSMCVTPDGRLIVSDVSSILVL
jgi:hypothetical protein